MEEVLSLWGRQSLRRPLLMWARALSLILAALACKRPCDLDQRTRSYEKTILAPRKKSVLRFYC